MSLQEDGIHDVIKVQLSSYCPPVETMGLVFHYNRSMPWRGSKGDFGMNRRILYEREEIHYMDTSCDYEILYMTFSTNNSSFPF